MRLQGKITMGRCKNREKKSAYPFDRRLTQVFAEFAELFPVHRYIKRPPRPAVPVYSSLYFS